MAAYAGVNDNPTFNSAKQVKFISLSIMNLKSCKSANNNPPAAVIPFMQQSVGIDN